MRHTARTAKIKEITKRTPVSALVLSDVSDLRQREPSFTHIASRDRITPPLDDSFVPRQTTTMSERKVLQKYYPPDFDPSMAKRRRKGKGGQQTVRLMAPYSMRCNTCGEYIYRGKKFNARKETAKGEEYFGIRVLRFYIKCPQCSSEITFKTDPRKADYAAEHGATRNFEPWRDPDADKGQKDELKLEDDEPVEVDPMKALEQRTLDSQREMEILDALQDIRTRNARMDRVDTTAVLESGALGKRKADTELTLEELAERHAEEEDEALVKQIFRRNEAEPADAGPEKEAPERSAEPFQTTEAPPPDPTSLLSENAREQIKSIGRSTVPKASRRRSRPNALGVVQKR